MADDETLSKNDLKTLKNVNNIVKIIKPIEIPVS